MIIHLVRAIYLLVILAFTVSYAFTEQVLGGGPTYVTLYILVPSLLAFGMVMLDMFWRKKRLSAFSGLFFGLLAGLVIAYVLSLVVGLVGTVFITGEASVDTPAAQAAAEENVESIAKRAVAPKIDRLKEEIDQLREEAEELREHVRRLQLGLREDRRAAAPTTGSRR